MGQVLLQWSLENVLNVRVLQIIVPATKATGPNSLVVTDDTLGNCSESADGWTKMDQTVLQSKMRQALAKLYVEPSGGQTGANKTPDKVR
jgi:hypothetical protein